MYEDFYDLFDIDKDADCEEVRSSFKDLVKEYHPDKTDIDNADEKINTIKVAKEVLLNDEKRDRYNEIGHETYLDEYIDEELKGFDFQTKESNNSDKTKENSPNNTVPPTVSDDFEPVQRTTSSTSIADKTERLNTRFIKLSVLTFSSATFYILCVTILSIEFITQGMTFELTLSLLDPTNIVGFLGLLSLVVCLSSLLYSAYEFGQNITTWIYPFFIFISICSLPIMYKLNFEPFLALILAVGIPVVVMTAYIVDIITSI